MTNVETISSERLRAYFDLSLSLLCTADAETQTFVDINPAWVDVLGWTVDELRSRPFTEFIHPDDLQPTFDVITDMTERGLNAVNFENRYRHANGSWVWLSWQATFHDGQFIASAHDISDYRRTTAALLEANDELKQFAYAASHDLREPLRSISGFLELIPTSELGPDARAAIAAVTRSSHRMQDLLDALLEYSRIETQGGRMAPCLVRESLQDAVSALDDSIRASEAHFEVEGTWPSLVVDRGQIARVFQNLLSNSIKYRKTGTRPTIRVRAEREGEGYRFEVVDDGIGFPDERSRRAFQIFQRLHRRSQYEGMGVGLALAKRIVHRHAGRVGIQSQPDEGTTAWFWLPMTGTPTS